MNTRTDEKSLFRTHAWTGIAAAAVLGLTACGGDGDADTGGEGGEGTHAVEHRFGTAEVEAPEDGELTVVALGRSDAEVALALGAQPAGVYDWMWMGEENHGVGPWAVDLVEEEPTYIGAAGEDYDFELIQSLAPDVILNVNSDYDEATHNRLSGIAPTVSGPEGAAPWMPGWDHQVELIAEALGVPEEGEQLIADVEEELASYAEENPEFSELTAVSAGKGAEQFGLNVGQDMRWRILEELGFELYSEAETAVGDSDAYFVDVSEEQVEVFNADIGVFFASGWTYEELTGDPLLNSLDVVEDERAVFIDPDSDLQAAFAAGNALSIPVVLEELTPQLQEAAAEVE